MGDIPVNTLITILHGITFKFIFYLEIMGSCDIIIKIFQIISQKCWCTYASIYISKSFIFKFLHDIASSSSLSQIIITRTSIIYFCLSAYSLNFQSNNIVLLTHKSYSIDLYTVFTQSSIIYIYIYLYKPKIYKSI